MNIESLKAFCGKNDIREWVNEPFRVGGDLCASNGHVICVLEGQADDATPETDNSIVPRLINDIRAADTFPIESVQEGNPTSCVMCNGTGSASFETCRECDGSGELDLESEYSTYWDIECKSCKGEGKTKRTGAGGPCPSCEGSGNKPESEAVWINENDSAIQKRYFDLIKDLPDLRVGTVKEGLGENIVFRFKDGFGCVMGLRNSKGPEAS